MRGHYEISSCPYHHHLFRGDFSYTEAALADGELGRLQLHYSPVRHGIEIIKRLDGHAQQVQQLRGIAGYSIVGPGDRKKFLAGEGRMASELSSCSSCLCAPLSRFCGQIYAVNSNAKKRFHLQRKAMRNQIGKTIKIEHVKRDVDFSFIKT
jgi:hypothetical protein